MLKYSLSIITEKPMIGAATSVSSAAGGMLLWFAHWTPLLAFFSALFGAVIGAITLWRMIFKQK